MKVRFWGVRGTIPSPGPNTIKYGGNTSCIEIRGDENELIVLDAGTGLRELGNYLISNDLKDGDLDIDILLSHTHWDHIQGFPSFGPAYIPSTTVTFRGPSNFSGKLADVIAGQMNYSYYPIKLDELNAKIEVHEITEDTFQLNNFNIRTIYLNHPILCLGYRMEYNGNVFVSIYDYEPYRNIFRDDYELLSDEERKDYDSSTLREADEYVELQNRKLIDFAKNADLLVYDAQYTDDEYRSKKKGWGHSTIEQAVSCAIDANVKRIALFHHDPLRTDAEVDDFQRRAIKLMKEKKRQDIIVFCARERLEIEF